MTHLFQDIQTDVCLWATHRIFVVVFSGLNGPGSFLRFSGSTSNFSDILSVLWTICTRFLPGVFIAFSRVNFELGVSPVPGPPSPWIFNDRIKVVRRNLAKNRNNYGLVESRRNRFESFLSKWFRLVKCQPSLWINRMFLGRLDILRNRLFTKIIGNF